MRKRSFLNHFTNHSALNQSRSHFPLWILQQHDFEKLWNGPTMTMACAMYKRNWRIANKSFVIQSVDGLQTIRRSLYYVCEIWWYPCYTAYFNVQSKRVYSPFKCTGVMFQFTWIAAHKKNKNEKNTFKACKRANEQIRRRERVSIRFIQWTTCIQ